MAGQSWEKHQLGEGVVLTRQNTALRDGELQSSSFCRLLPGNREQLYPDIDYTSIPLAYDADDEILNIFLMPFESGQHWLVVVLRTYIGGEQLGQVDLYNLDSPTTSNSGQRVPTTKSILGFRADEASLIPAGSEYFLGVSGDYPSIDSSRPNRKRGYQRVYYIDESGSLATREAGFAPSTLDIESEQRFPQLGSALYSLPNLNDEDFWEYDYDWFTLVGRDLYGSEAAFSEAFETTAQREAIRNLFRDVAPPVAFGEIMTRAARIASVTMKGLGAGAVFAYWATELWSDFNVESAPSDLTTVTNSDPATAYWEVVLDWNSIIQGVNGDSDGSGFTGRAALLDEYFTDNGPGGSNFVFRAGMRDGLFELKDLIAQGAFPERQVIEVPMSDVQREAVQNAISISGDLANNSADKIRLWRQNLGIIEEFEVPYERGRSGTPSNPDYEGEGARNARDISAGRQTRQGGLLEEFDASARPISYEDYLRESGTADPGTAYPVVNWLDRGGLGIYDYLRRPSNWGVGAAMGEVLLRVPWDVNISSNSIMVSPANDPEQQPLIWRIPIVTQRQDSVRALRPFRDRAIAFTRNSTFVLNYTPFEGTNQADRVLTQLSGDDGVPSQRRTLTLSTGRGQLVVFLSDVGLMATDGRGVFDACPDFSIASAQAKGYTFTDVHLVNNPAEYRIEMWADGVRWDFLYHASHLKDIRGDGSGLVFKLMGPHVWYDAGSTVSAACSGEWNGRIVTFHILKGSGSGHSLVYSGTVETERSAVVVTRKLWGRDPKSRRRIVQAGLQHGNDVTFMSIGVGSTPVDEVGGTDQTLKSKLDPGDGFSERFFGDGLGSSSTFTVTWAGGAVGPLWTQAQEAYGATGP